MIERPPVRLWRYLPRVRCTAWDARPVQAPPLQLKLVGTVTGPQGHQYAILEDLRTQGVQALYQIGDSVQQALLRDIRATCVEFDTGGPSEVLCFQDDTDVAKTTGRRPVLPPAPAHATASPGGPRVH